MWVPITHAMVTYIHMEQHQINASAALSGSLFIHADTNDPSMSVLA